MAYFSGTVRHKVCHGCRLECGYNCRRKNIGRKQCYAASLKPNNYNVNGCDHPDYNITDMPGHSYDRYMESLTYMSEATSKANYKQRRLQTGILKPTIFLGINKKHCLGIPAMFTQDHMHIFSLNFTSLLLDLWTSKMDCDDRDDMTTWEFAVL
jgi:hypothetical protein